MLPIAPGQQYVPKKNDEHIFSAQWCTNALSLLAWYITQQFSSRPDLSYGSVGKC